MKTNHTWLQFDSAQRILNINFLFIVLSSVSGCYNPDWSVLVGQSSVNAVQYIGPQSAQECLDYCGQQVGCVAVDINTQQIPPSCWPHFSATDLLPDNSYPQTGINQYSLIDRCSNVSLQGRHTLALKQISEHNICETWTGYAQHCEKHCTELDINSF